MNWCCLCKLDGESVVHLIHCLVAHLLIHCLVAGELWASIISWFGVAWVFSQNVIEILDYWQGAKVGKVFLLILDLDSRVVRVLQSYMV